ncbi:hypothetical protein QJS64_13650 [Paraclostridium bifermentans]|uniref:Uncharacterized protein n=1 Tax=Paraclostridium bifermentans TaxID=1490 RepID=A0ABY8R283_PARBF|nr:hypothetical protein QJS64_13650 [Paraclostridium bifermentans]
MNFKNLSIIFVIVILIFTSSVNIGSAIETYNDTTKQIIYTDSLIKGLYSKLSKFPSKEDDVVLAIKAILSFYKLSLLKAGDYMQARNTEDLINSISSYSVGYNASSSLSKIINEVRK